MPKGGTNMTNCRLCSNNLIHDPSEVWNVPLLESPNFIVLPSLGALVEGWLLLVPKEHFICMGELPRSLAAELQELKHRLCSALYQFYGHVCVFEHGPSQPNLRVGCGVDHAHLHIVPLGFDLASAVNPLLPKDTFWSKAGLQDCRDAFRRGDDYLYLEQSSGVGRIVTSRDFGSQLFRRAIATQIGASHFFNWREFPQYPNIISTIEKFQSWDGSLCPPLTGPVTVG
jgi:diadenosine tetraphosphate (Ap4A) HIT family hydrolase